MSCGVGHRRGLDPELLWCRLVATALIRPLAQEPPYATGEALENVKQKDKKKQKTKKTLLTCSSSPYMCSLFTF